MKTQPDDLLPIGLRDRLPAAAANASAVEQAALGVMHSHGYDRVRPPLMEFETSLAGRMDGVSTRRMVRFTDPASLRTIALRSDMTPQVGRIAATAMAEAPRPLRVCYAGDVARLAADQLSPERQSLQIGAELVGSDGAAAAGEIVAVAIAALEAGGAQGISVDFTLPDLVDILSAKALPLEAGQVDAVRRELDTKDAGGLRDAGGADYLPLLYSSGPFEEAIDKLAAIDAGGALASRIEGLRQIAARVEGHARVTLDPTERHGFEYQTWFGFTLYAEGVRGALGRGGTYRIGGTDEAASGVSLYVDGLIDSLPEAVNGKVLFLPLSHDAMRAEALRGEGWRTVAAVSDQDDATSLGASHVLQGGAPVAL
ncbi:ATP phosphoribosyltransferase regulatory subunit [Alteripontixanthobacter maritimus]|uniref:ATP phosphoribosyltransferase regulatory subunit n=1 Tax=Alteripontixanthobacter maritimus TaxID=2161824 RepID=A0A369Q805_9SPHN|nr:ATP phosphoribosyltransferase regulatory subunit [Alteripontixanthobacter maritimus]RDC60592.1 ATP phosphoribosyltransferase regulatory subunit [Alteripontixanthobacter maritimus]